VLILPTEIIFPLGEAISAEAEAAFPSRKTIFPSSKMVLLEAEAIFPSSEMTFPSRKMVLLDAEAIFPSSETIFPSRKMVLLDAEATFPSGKMTFPEAEAAFPEAEAAATAAKTTGLPVKNLKNGVKTPLPPARRLVRLELRVFNCGTGDPADSVPLNLCALAKPVAKEISIVKTGWTAVSVQLTLKPRKMIGYLTSRPLSVRRHSHL